MRLLRLMLIVTSISLICVLCCSLVSALNADEASVSLLWSSQKVYPNDVVSVRITLQSNYAEQLKIYALGLHFDWMPSDSFSGPDLSESPVTVPSQGTYISDPIVIQIPLNATTGPHSYFVGIDGTEGLSASSFSWSSPSFTIEIRSILESIYDDLLPTVENKLNGAKSANYASSEAQSLLQQAQDAFYNATISASAQDWSTALENLSIADDFLDQAIEAEQSSAEQQVGLQSLLVYLAIIAIVVIVVISIIVVVVRKRRKRHAEVVDQRVDQSSDEQTETQDYTPEE